MRRWMTMLICSAVLLLSGAASADVSKKQLVDWEEAIAYAEYIDSFVDKDGVKWDEYWDGEQKVHWAQVTSLTEEEALAEALYEQEGLGDSPLRTDYVVPYAMRVYEDATTYYTTWDIRYPSGNCGFRAPPVCHMYGANWGGTFANMVRVVGWASSDTDYCDGDYKSWWWDTSYPGPGEGWKHDTDDDCWNGWPSGHYYKVDATDNDLDYGALTDMVDFRYKISGDNYYSRVHLIVVPEK